MAIFVKRKKRKGMKEYIQENRERFFEELFSLLRIPSISAKQDHKKDMERCAERLKELLLEAGADEAGVYPSKGNPVVFGKKIINPEWKTVMVYGHYDVQPPVLLGVRVRLVAGVDDRTVEGGLQADVVLHVVSTLRDLEAGNLAEIGRAHV